MTEVKRTAEEWLALPTYEGVVVYDPDGWDRRPDKWEASWSEKITEGEFCSRLVKSTCKYPAGYWQKFRSGSA